MRLIALRSLVHDTAKLVAALAGVTFAMLLVLTQLGMYAGFLESASAVITRTKGDLWVMAAGTRVFDIAESLSAGAWVRVGAHPCIRRIRGLVTGFSTIRTRDLVVEGVQVIGFDPVEDVAFPWSFAQGLPGDLHGASRVSVDVLDLARLGISAPAIGTQIDLGDKSAWIGAVTGGIRAFTLSPYLFMERASAARYLGTGDDRVQFLVLDLADRRCAPAVKAAIAREDDLQAIETARFARMTEAYWVDGAGAGAALALGAVLGLVVGIVIVGQTLYSLTMDYRRELAMLKALGGTDVELLGFVAWQAGALGVAGSLAGLAVAWMVARAAAMVGVAVVLTASSIAVAFVAIALMCAVAAIWTARAIVRLDASEVFR